MTETTGQAAQHRNGNDRSLGAIITEIKEELKEFLNTRVNMVKTELQETRRALRVALPLSILALALFSTAFLLLTAAVVMLVAHAFVGNPLAWFYASLIVAVVWLVLAGACVSFAYNSFRGHSLFPQRTIKVLKADKAWLQTEARSHP